MPAKPRSDLGPDGKRLIKRLAASFAECRKEAKAYGACIALHVEGVERNACEKEFTALSSCFRAASSKARARGQ